LVSVQVWAQELGWARVLVQDLEQAPARVAGLAQVQEQALVQVLE
jgi:hypothetical protein